jgi:hypothetical protein
MFCYLKSLPYYSETLNLFLQVLFFLHNLCQQLIPCISLYLYVFIWNLVDFLVHSLTTLPDVHGSWWMVSEWILLMLLFPGSCLSVSVHVIYFEKICRTCCFHTQNPTSLHLHLSHILFFFTSMSLSCLLCLPQAWYLIEFILILYVSFLDENFPVSSHHCDNIFTLHSNGINLIMT